MADAEDVVLISALNHYAFCPRRCALIHVEGVFEENAFTVEGSLGHERVDQPSREEKDGIVILKGLPLYSLKFRIVGKADVVELRALPGQAAAIPYPVDYKRGRRKHWENDDVQLCAQAFCLEEMLGVPCPKGAVYHMGSKKRREVTFSPDLRQETERTVVAVRRLLLERRIPAPVLQPKCDGCSLRSICLPEVDPSHAPLRKALRALFQPLQLS